MTSSPVARLWLAKLQSMPAVAVELQKPDVLLVQVWAEVFSSSRAEPSQASRTVHSKEKEEKENTWLSARIGRDSLIYSKI